MYVKDRDVITLPKSCPYQQVPRYVIIDAPADVTQFGHSLLSQFQSKIHIFFYISLNDFFCAKCSAECEENLCIFRIIIGAKF